MKKVQLGKIAEKVVESLEGLPYAEASKRAKAKQVDASEMVENGERLSVEVQYFFDSGRSGPVKIFVNVDDGGLTAFFPVTRATIIYDR